MKKFVIPIALTVLCGCAPVSPQFPTCDVEAYLRSRPPPSESIIECDTLDNFSASSNVNGLVFWQCIRDAVASGREFHAVVKGFVSRDTTGSLDTRIELYSLRWGASSGVFWRYANVGSGGGPWSAPGATLKLWGTRSGPVVAMQRVVVLPEPLSRAILLTDGNVEIAFPPPEITRAFIDHLQVARVIPDVSNERWCRGF